MDRQEIPITPTVQKDAKQRKPKSPDGLEVAEEDWGWVWTGTREELIAAGVCTAEQFPLRPKRIARYSPQGEPSEKDDRGWQTRVRTGGRYQHTRWKRLDEIKAARAAARAAENAEKDRRNQERIEMFTVPEKFRAQMVYATTFGMEILFSYASGQCGRDRSSGRPHLWLDSESYQRLVELKANMLAIVENGRICGPETRPALRLVK